MQSGVNGVGENSSTPAQRDWLLHPHCRNCGRDCMPRGVEFPSVRCLCAPCEKAFKAFCRRQYRRLAEANITQVTNGPYDQYDRHTFRSYCIERPICTELLAGDCECGTLDDFNTIINMTEEQFSEDLLFTQWLSKEVREAAMREAKGLPPKIRLTREEISTSRRLLRATIQADS